MCAVANIAVNWAQVTKESNVKSKVKLHLFYIALVIRLNVQMNKNKSKRHSWVRRES